MQTSSSSSIDLSKRRDNATSLDSSTGNYVSSIQQQINSVSQPSSNFLTETALAQNDSQLCCKYIILAVSVFVACLCYLIIWMSTKHSFIPQQNITLVREYQRIVEDIRESVRLKNTEQLKTFIRSAPRVAQTSCTNFLEYNCQNWLLVMPHNQSYQEFLYSQIMNSAHEKYLDLAEWNPMNDRHEILRFNPELNETQMYALRKCIDAVGGEGASEALEGSEFLKFFLAGVCRVATNIYFQDIINEVVSFCVSACNYKYYPLSKLVDWTLLCQTLTFFASEIRALLACAASPALTPCSNIRNGLEEMCVSYNY